MVYWPCCLPTIHQYWNWKHQKQYRYIYIYICMYTYTLFIIYSIILYIYIYMIMMMIFSCLCQLLTQKPTMNAAQLCQCSCAERVRHTCAWITCCRAADGTWCAVVDQPFNWAYQVETRMLHRGVKDHSPYISLVAVILRTANSVELPWPCHIFVMLYPMTM